jgi:tRNA modification GTPase
MEKAEALEEWGENTEHRRVQVISKVDMVDEELSRKIKLTYPQAVFISAKSGIGIEELKEHLRARVVTEKVQPGATIITNTRHLAALEKIATAIADIKAGMDANIPGDLIALDIRQALHYIGELTGQVQTDRDVLGAIFGKFCIGK